MHEECEPWLVQDKDKKECLSRKASGHVHGLTDQSKHKTKKQKNKTLKRLFGLASKVFFFKLFFCLFWFWNATPKKNLCLFCFLKVYGWRKSPKTKKTQVKPKKQSFEAKPKSFFKVLVFWFLVLRFWGYCHSLHMTSFQIYQDNEQGLYYLCVCVLKDMIQEALRWISGGSYHIYIYVIYIMIWHGFWTWTTYQLGCTNEIQRFLPLTMGWFNWRHMLMGSISRHLLFSQCFMQIPNSHSGYNNSSTINSNNI